LQGRGGEVKVSVGVLPRLHGLETNQEVQVVNICHARLRRARAKEIQAVNAQFPAQSCDCSFLVDDLLHHALIVHGGEHVVSGGSAGNYMLATASSIVLLCK
jgi:hypothetical protein